MTIEPRPAIEPREAVEPATAPQSTSEINDAVADAIKTNLARQLLRWDMGTNVPQGVDAPQFIGNNISNQVLRVSLGKKEHEEIFGNPDRDQGLGPVVLSVGSVVDGTLNTKRGGDNVAQGSSDLKTSPQGVIVNPAAKNAASNLALLFSRAVQAKQENNTLRVPEQHWTTPGLVSANSVEDLVTGLNAVLDKDLQIDTALVRGRG